MADAIDPPNTLFIVSSQIRIDDGARTAARLFLPRAGKQEAGATASLRCPRFVAVTDPGSKLEKRPPGRTASRTSSMVIPRSAGGYSGACRCSGWCPPPRSAWTCRCLVRNGPRRWSNSVGADAPPANNPGVKLRHRSLARPRSMGRNKLTILVPSPTLRPFGSWLEQLLAESHGQAGQGDRPRRSRGRLGASDGLWR